MSIAWVLARSPLPLPFSRSKERGGGTARALTSVGAGDSAASSLPGEGIAGSSRSQESLVLAYPDPVASSRSPRGDRRSHLGGRGDYRRPLLLSLFLFISPLSVSGGS